MKLINPPDFDDMVKVSTAIREKALEKKYLELAIEKAESDIILKVTNDPTFFHNGKAPSVSFIKSAYMFQGLNGELIEVRQRLADVSAELDHLKREFELMKGMLDVWRTESANKRASVV